MDCLDNGGPPARRGLTVYMKSFTDFISAPTLTENKTAGYLTLLLNYLKVILLITT